MQHSDSRVAIAKKGRSACPGLCELPPKQHPCGTHTEKIVQHFQRTFLLCLSKICHTHVHGQDGWTALHFVAASRDYEYQEEEGQDIKSNKGGPTWQQKQKDMIQRLLERKANLEERTNVRAFLF